MNLIEIIILLVLTKILDMFNFNLGNSIKLSDIINIFVALGTLAMAATSFLSVKKANKSIEMSEKVIEQTNELWLKSNDANLYFTIKIKQFAEERYKDDEVVLEIKNTGKSVAENIKLDVNYDTSEALKTSRYNELWILENLEFKLAPEECKDISLIDVKYYESGRMIGVLTENDKIVIEGNYDGLIKNKKVDVILIINNFVVGN